jgi:small subunit ribosomal protein S16
VLAIRLTRKGQKKLPVYRIVVTNKTNARDGKYLEVVGTYSPRIGKTLFTLKEDRIKFWIGNGAQPSKVVSNLIKKQIPGFLEQKLDAQRKKIQAKRKKRKAATKSAKKSAK